MKFSKETLALLKNFAGINSNLLLKAGNRLSTVSTQKNVMAHSSITETFTSDFGIYDLNEFLGAMSLFEDPDMEFTDKFVKISSGNQSIKYFAAEASVLVAPTKDSLPVDADVSFDLTAEQLGMIIKTASVLRASDVSIIGGDGIITVSVGDKKNATANSYSFEIGTDDREYQVNLRVENLKMVLTDYSVAVSSKRISKFAAKKGDLTYYVAVEADSKIAL
jgi:hypothetical protein